MNRNVLIALVVGLLLLAGGYFALNSFNNASKSMVPADNPGPTNSVTTDSTQPSSPSAAAEAGSMDASQEIKIEMTGFKFASAAITVKRGTKVTWTNQDSVKHNTSSTDGTFKGPLLAKGESYSYTFDKTGTFNYICDPHPFMKGSVTVTE